MARVTNDDLDAVTDNLNRRLAGRGSAFRVAANRRNGYVALDKINEFGQVADVLTFGTARYVYDAAWHMIRGLDLLP